MYLFLTTEKPEAYPNAKIPTVELPAADPPFDAALAAVADAFTQPEYVYLSRVVDATQLTLPKANMPVVEFPVAEPMQLTALAAVADPLVSLE